MEEINKKDNKKKSKAFVIYIVITILIVLILISLFIAFNNIGLLNLDGKSNKNNKLVNKIEGVYITDVSEVVENVMPSIVAITSKTLINNGYFGPNFFSDEQYSEGAGSGIIISRTDNELLVLTNNHVIEGAEALTVQFVNGKM